jgi:hypothetical protein
VWHKLDDTRAIRLPVALGGNPSCPGYHDVPSDILSSSDSTPRLGRATPTISVIPGNRYRGVMAPSRPTKGSWPIVPRNDVLARAAKKSARPRDGTVPARHSSIVHRDQIRSSDLSNDDIQGNGTEELDAACFDETDSEESEEEEESDCALRPQLLAEASPLTGAGVINVGEKVRGWV